MLDFGAQRGDPSRVVNMDLSTCVNRYGPAPAAIAALHSIEPADILLHPYEAAPAGLLAVAVAHPAATLVVDESYIDFTPDPAGWSVIGCEVPNIVVLRSTTKFYGIAATRTGIAWCAESEPLACLFGQQENWGLSGVDVRVACAAVRDVDWSDDSRAQMKADNAWLADIVSDVPGLDLYANDNVHFQFAFCERSHEVAEVFRRCGIGIRVLGAAHGVRPDALRIVAPRHDERARFAETVSDVVDERVAA
jgi:histidinol-phosphate/aromatic aminotransferase/cobyric acid decarboxylase-like protein